ncbi:MAG: nuclear transport factor 2 family protein [Bacteroidetes bacterium]|nr:nuclear transport factor 2 family protein [Bacteroidota bacterium]
MQEREQMIQAYVEAYNRFDVEGMLVHLDENIQFENISNGEVTLSLIGKEAIRQQAEQSKGYFSERCQTITSFKHENNLCEIEVDYEAVLDIDLPMGLKKGDRIQLDGRSVFQFENNKIIALTDIS